MRRSIGFPLGLGIVLTLLLFVLWVGWQRLVVVVSELRPVARGLTPTDYLLLVVGTVVFLLALFGLGWLLLWLMREMRLNQSQRAFLDAVTHEMKTPLASLRLYLDTLARHDPEPARRREFLGRMREDLERLDHTVEQVLVAARAEESAKPSLREPLPLAEMLGECIDEVCSRQQVPGGAVQLECPPGAAVYGDRGELAVVFRNLIENAVKYSDVPIEVKVAVRAAGAGRLEVEISDRGIGIPPAELRRIFQRFHRASRDVQRTAAGMGLGLFIVRNLVRRQGGRVVARSEGRGTGSRFVVTLRAPREQAAEGPAGARSGGRSADEPRRPAAAH